jgi:hypothetical protein
MERETALALETVYGILEELLADYQRRQDQAILQQDLYKANYALAGKETCAEVKRRVEMRLQMHENMVRELSSRKRA